MKFVTFLVIIFILSCCGDSKQKMKEITIKYSDVDRINDYMIKNDQKVEEVSIYCFHDLGSKEYHCSSSMEIVIDKNKISKIRLEGKDFKESITNLLNRMSVEFP